MRMNVNIEGWDYIQLDVWGVFGVGAAEEPKLSSIVATVFSAR